MKLYQNDEDLEIFKKATALMKAGNAKLKDIKEFYRIAREYSSPNLPGYVTSSETN